MPAHVLTLYHHTSNAAAVAILRDRSMISSAPVDLPQPLTRHETESA